MSIVNVDSTAFFRYSRIMLRKDGSSVGIPIAVVTDCDVRPYDVVKQEDSSKKIVFSEKNDESAQAVKYKRIKYEAEEIHAFISPKWTLEYCIASSCLSDRFHKAIHYGKTILNSGKISLTDEKISSADDDVTIEAQKWDTLPIQEKAFNMYNTMHRKQEHKEVLRWAGECGNTPQPYTSGDATTFCTTAKPYHKHHYIHSVL